MRKDIKAAEEMYFNVARVHFDTVAQRKIIQGLIKTCIATGVDIANAYQYHDGCGYQGNG